MGKPENAVESYLRTQSERLGYLCWKFVSPAKNGVPDRLLIGHGQTFFVETKAPGKTTRSQQKATHKVMIEHGAEVYVADTRKKIDKLLRYKAPPDVYQRALAEPAPKTGTRMVGTVHMAPRLKKDVTVNINDLNTGPDDESQ